MVVSVNKVFVPGAFPEFTFVDRKQGSIPLAERVAEALDAPGMMVALVGPSKSGKTQLLRKALEGREFRRISCSEISTPRELFDAILSELGVPLEEKIQNTSSTNRDTSGQLDLEIPVGPLKVKAGGKSGQNLGESNQISRSMRLSGMRRAIDEANSRNCTIFLDNFHYIAPQNLKAICQALRSAIEEGLSCCVAYVPHKKDIILQGNPDLNNKVIKIEVGNWSETDLAEIARLGFKKLKHEIEGSWPARLAREACFSPQLMQQLCYDFCMVHRIKEEATTPTAFYPDENLLRDALDRTAQSIHFDGLINTFIAGRIERKNEKQTYAFSNGRRGNFYECLMYILSLDPPRLVFPRSELQARVKRVPHNAKSKRPTMQLIDSAVRFLVEQARTEAASEFLQKVVESLSISKEDLEYIPSVEYIEDKKELHIVDPSLLFFIRNNANVIPLTESAS